MPQPKYIICIYVLQAHTHTEEKKPSGCTHDVPHIIMKTPHTQREHTHNQINKPKFKNASDDKRKAYV